MYRWKSAVLSVAVLSCAGMGVARAQAEPLLGQLMWTAATFCPRGWAEANGQLLPISSNTALFSLLGTTYGGDGRVTFALPDLRGRVALHAGAGPGLGDYPQGSRGGSEAVTLTAEQMPTHNHALNASADVSDKNAAGSILGSPKQRIYDAPVNASTTLASSAVADAGGGQSHENRSPFLTVRACIAITGIYPSRD